MSLTASFILKFLQNLEYKNTQKFILTKFPDQIPWQDGVDINRWTSIQIADLLPVSLPYILWEKYSFILINNLHWIQWILQDNWLSGNCTTHLSTLYSDQDYNFHKSDELIWNSKHTQLSGVIGKNGMIQSWDRWTSQTDAVCCIYLSLIRLAQ